MKNTIIVLLSFIILISCNENFQSELEVPQKKELYYKTKLEKLLNTEFKNNNGKPIDETVTHFKFETYEAGYNYFKFLESRELVFKTDTIKISNETSSPLSTSSRIAALETRNYSAALSSTAAFSYLVGGGSITAIYRVDFMVGYAYNLNQNNTKTYTSAQILYNQATTPSLTYAGNYSVNPSSPALAVGTYGGTYTGAMQGIASFGGIVSGSFIVNYSGGYQINITTTPINPPTVVSWLSCYVAQ